MAIKRIMVALGGSEYMNLAMREAAVIAKRHTGKVYGLVVLDEDLVNPNQPIPVGGGAAAKELREFRTSTIEQEVADAIDRFTTYFSSEGIEHEVIRETGSAIPILERTLKLMDMGIFGIRHAFDYGTIAHSEDFLGSVARATRRPIMAIPSVLRPIERVLVAYDGSPASADTLRSFSVLHAFDPSDVRVVTCRDSDIDGDATMQEAVDYLTAHGYSAHGIVVEGSPAVAIPDQAAEFSADMIVMGAVGRSGIMKMLIGDTAGALLASSETPLYLRY